VISANNGWKFRCIVSSTTGCTPATSNEATLSVSASTTPIINTQPVSQTFCSGSTANISLTATGPSLTYQWLSSTTLSGSYTNISGETATTLSISTGVATTTYFKCLITESCGSITTTSNVATIQVSSSTVVSATISSTISTICAGTNKTFTATPLNEGSAPVYAWYKNGAEVTGQAASSYSITNLASGDAIYATVTSNKACAIGSPASSNSISTTVNALPTVNNITGLSSVEYGSSIVLVNTTASGIWASSAPSIATVSSGTISALTLGNTNISYTVIDSQSPACTNSATKSITVNVASSTITATGLTTYTYTGSAQGPNTSTKSGSTGAVTYSYSGTGTTTYSSSATVPTNAGTYQLIASLTSDGNYAAASSIAYAFTISLASSTITATGLTTYTYTGSAQGPSTSTKSGSTGAVTYSYSGTGTTTYSASATAPTNAGTYQVIASLASDGNYAAASSSAYVFTINKVTAITKTASTIVATGLTTYTYTGSAQGPAGSTVTGSTGALTYSYSGTGTTTYSASANAPINPGTYQLIATVATDDNYNAATSVAYTFTINKAASTIVATGLASFTYNASAQGPAGSTVTGSKGAVTYSYIGTGTNVFAASATAPIKPGTYQLIATVASDDNYVAATSNAFNFEIIQIFPPPVVVSVKLIIDQQNLPTTLAALVISNPVGTIPAWCDVNNTNCTTVAPKVPAVIGTHIFLLKSYDTTTLLYSTSFVNDTIIIAPAKPKALDTTFVLGVRSNPSNISSQVSGLAEASFNYYINNTIQNGTPALSKKVGTFSYSVSQVVNNIESDKAVFKINILDPSSIIQLDHVIDSGILQSNSTFNYTFNFTLSNLSSYPFSNVVISDNLHNTIPITSDFSIIKNIAGGSLIPNNSFNSNSDVDIIQKSSSLAPLSKNAASFTMNLSPRGFVGSLSNIAFVKADTKWGTIETQSSPASFYVKDLTISIPEGFSPNHDGVHDYFVIIRPSNITIDLKIFNRWGNFVYTNSNYKNEWDGTGTDNFLGQELPEGGYYYTVRAIDEQGKVQVFNGYVILKR